MKLHSRIRKTAKWGGAAVTVLLVAVWIGSGWSTVIWQTSDRRFRVTLQSGRIGLAEMFAKQDPKTSGWHFSTGDRRFDWMWARHTGRNFDARWLPMWVPALAAAMTTAMAWRRDALARRRARQNLCSTCNYDRTGLDAAAVCPECGTPCASRA